jgi:NAD(P)-dependent dehydrogenase (short-subunit alcohol dehydrogenase family)
VTERTLRDKRVLVVGASAGIGRAFAVHAVRAGAQTVLAARRKARLDEAVDEAGGGIVVAGDVGDPLDCERIVAEAAATLGELDLVLYSVGYAPLRRLADVTVDDWRAVFDANLVGAHQIVRATLPWLAPGAIVAALSSETVGQGRSRSALGAYSASKAALEETLRIWRIEHPRVRFCCVSVGPTVPTEFGSDFDADLLHASIDDWIRHGLAHDDFMATDDVAHVLADVFGSALGRPGVGIDHITLRSPSPVAGTSGLPSAGRDHS